MKIFYSGINSVIGILSKSKSKHVDVMFTYWEQKKKPTKGFLNWCTQYNKENKKERQLNG